MSLRLPSWLRSKPERPLITELRAPKISFLAEQDGPVERTIKERWLPVLSANPRVRRAFLVRASYEGPEDVHVVLALCSSGGPDLSLIEALRAPYAAIFARECPLDMVFANSAQEAELEKVCRPFYAAV